jgi:hypothetical protein
MSRDTAGMISAGSKCTKIAGYWFFAKTPLWELTALTQNRQQELMGHAV